MEANEVKIVDSQSYQVHPVTGKVLEQVTRYKRIPVPKLAAKTRIGTEDLGAVLKNLSDEGVVKIQKDKLGFDWVEWVATRKDKPRFS